MTTTDDLLELRDAADALGVHYQTAYRWVRNGRLPAQVLNGKYAVAQQDLDAVARRRLVATAPPSPGARRLDRQAERMSAALFDGDEATARSIAVGLVADGTTVVDLIQSVIAPPLREIGQAWHDGELSIWTEHRASAIVERVLGEIAPRPRGRRRGTAMVAAVSGDRHSLPTTMAAVALREANWHVHHLGADMPPDELLAFVAEHEVDVAVISLTNPDRAGSATSTAEQLRRLGTPTIVGGSGQTLDDLVAAASEAMAPR